jgi:hypothetical protein
MMSASGHQFHLLHILMTGFCFHLLDEFHLLSLRSAHHHLKTGFRCLPTCKISSLRTLSSTLEPSTVNSDVSARDFDYFHHLAARCVARLRHCGESQWTHREGQASEARRMAMARRHLRHQDQQAAVRRKPRELRHCHHGKRSRDAP